MTEETNLADRFHHIQHQVIAACERSRREPSDITIVGASKTQPIEKLSWAWSAGLQVFGENRVQEALAKSQGLPDEIDWHLIGPLQSNKARKAVELFSTIHSIDRIKIARVLDREASKIGRKLCGFVEVNLAGEPTKHGFDPRDLVNQIEPLSDLSSLEIIGLMAIPPFEADPAKARDWFRALRKLRDELILAPVWKNCPGYLSMGMSHDYELAVEEEATHVRIGTALFGPREP
jgi:pyridoxal phosphate enzyme (YggS family)